MKKFKCVHCKIPKNEDEFSWSNKRKGIRNNRCKECQKAYSKLHYNKAKENYLDTQRKIRDRNHLYISNYLQNNPCIDCGESNIIVLQFDHINQLEKKSPDHILTNAIRNKWSFKRIDCEINKCAVRCANCHIKRHAEEIGTYRWNYMLKLDI